MPYKFIMFKGMSVCFDAIDDTKSSKFTFIYFQGVLVMQLDKSKIKLKKVDNKNYTFEFLGE